MFEKILIAGRGETALRILRACQEMGIRTVTVHSTADTSSMHVRLADESICIGPPASAQSYMNIPAILSAAHITNVDAIHPGIGFLSENADFAAMVEDHGFTFIGPSPNHIEIMGDKIRAKKTAKILGLPTIPGSDEPVLNFDDVKKQAEHIGFPLLIKAVAGGGGRGIYTVFDTDGLEEAYDLARREGKTCFGSDAIYLEKYLLSPRHIEVQILGDAHGNIVHLGERDCSVQRRRQKIWEECPSPVLTPEMRRRLGERTQKAMKKLRYKSAGTVEYLYENGQFYFMEMNTRLQVEHPITEMVTGIDLVKQQIRIAAGYPLSFSQKDVTLRGHAIECRINAENPETFLPSPRRVEACLVPGGPHVRVDSIMFPGYQVPPFYDSLVAKLVIFGDTRQECLMRVRRALNEFVVVGIDTLIPLHKRIAHASSIMTGTYDIHWLETFLEDTAAEKNSES